MFKKIIFVAGLALAVSMPTYAAETKKEPETKKVCIKTTDPKTKKEVEKCRTMKKHEKHEGTVVPDGKKK